MISLMLNMRPVAICLLTTVLLGVHGSSSTSQHLTLEKGSNRDAPLLRRAVASNLPAAPCDGYEHQRCSGHCKCHGVFLVNCGNDPTGWLQANGYQGKEKATDFCYHRGGGGCDCLKQATVRDLYEAGFTAPTDLRSHEAQESHNVPEAQRDHQHVEHGASVEAYVQTEWPHLGIDHGQQRHIGHPVADDPLVVQPVVAGHSTIENPSTAHALAGSHLAPADNQPAVNGATAPALADDQNTHQQEPEVLLVRPSNVRGVYTWRAHCFGSRKAECESCECGVRIKRSNSWINGTPSNCGKGATWSNFIDKHKVAQGICLRQNPLLGGACLCPRIAKTKKVCVGADTIAVHFCDKRCNYAISKGLSGCARSDGSGSEAEGRKDKLSELMESIPAAAEEFSSTVRGAMGFCKSEKYGGCSCEYQFVPGYFFPLGYGARKRLKVQAGERSRGK